MTTEQVLQNKDMRIIAVSDYSSHKDFDVETWLETNKLRRENSDDFLKQIGMHRIENPFEPRG